MFEVEQSSRRISSQDAWFVAKPALRASCWVLVPSRGDIANLRSKVRGVKSSHRAVGLKKVVEGGVHLAHVFSSIVANLILFVVPKHGDRDLP